MKAAKLNKQKKRRARRSSLKVAKTDSWQTACGRVVSASGGIGGHTSLSSRLSALAIVQELCESRGGRPRLSVLTSLLVSVDVKNY